MVRPTSRRNVSPPALARETLLRVLALPPDASPSAIRAASGRLSGWLAARRDALPLESEAERRALTGELDELVASTVYWASDALPVASPFSLERIAAGGPGAVVLGSLVLLAVMLFHASGLRVTRSVPVEPASGFAQSARLVLAGALDGATLRVFDADRSRVLDERPAKGARLELDPGRYAVEVQSEVCAETWTRSVYLEPGRVHRLEPELCAGHGRLVVRANTVGDRLTIDGVEVGRTGGRPHRLTVGEHTVRVEKPGFGTFETKVEVRRDETSELRAELATVDGSDPKAATPPPFAVATAGAQAAAAAKIAQGFTPEELRPKVEPVPVRDEDLGLQRRGRFLARDGLAALPDGGSTAWHDRVSKELRDRFDTDRSGEIDRLAESEAIGCAVWREIEQDFDRGSLGLSLAHYYGFDGSEWHPGALAVARSHRSAVYAKMLDCGLTP